MFQFVNSAELFFTAKWSGKYALIIKKKYLTFYNQSDRRQHIYSTEW
ncbi:hypothetical protein [Klebsiella pneumoniae IS43]|uniref:Uncharacterized protein n=1 Tax=Klebsiella pneumoniae IS43 TaxID=1432552 RepID=W1DIC6_KLEPN|nr:hypothetical protein [Klebsiella pneumoniae IS43]